MISRLLIESLLHDSTIVDLIRSAEQRYWQLAIINDPDISTDIAAWARISYLLSFYAIDNDLSDKEFESIYRLLRSYPIDDNNARHSFNNLLGFSFGDSYLCYYFILASVALRANQTVAARLVLDSYHQDAFEEKDWFNRLLVSILRSLLFLIRKKDGYSDIQKAITLILKLREEQRTYEETYLTQFALHRQTYKALQLMALYHTSKALVEAAEYVIRGYDYTKGNKRIDATIRQHIDIALGLINKQEALYGFISTVYVDLKYIVSNSIWSKTGFQDRIKQLCKNKADLGILELLPSQIEAINKRLFDVAANAIILQMPTSAGKTLLAEFNIIVNRSLLPDSKVVYVAPSRALVNQVYHDLSDDLIQLGMSISKTSSVNEVDPTENAFISFNSIDVLVSTPEKLDLLVRRNHPSVENVSLFIIDEAHMINSGERGARLELLIAMLRRERPSAKFMLLSPFLPGDSDSLVEWLGGGNAIEVDWRPSEKIVLGVGAHGNSFSIQSLQSPFTSNSISIDTISIPLSYISKTSPRSKARILEFCCNQFSETGKAMMILCKVKTSANNTAAQILDWIEAPKTVPNEVRTIQRYIEEEIGCSTIYSKALSKGIAIHHAGIPDDIRILIEHLIRKRLIRIVCATSTIAEGVNFPVTSVYFDTYYRGQNNLLSANDFWNISGRAGRTLVDEFGRIILPFDKKENIEKGLGLISRSAEEIVSVLSRLFIERENVLSILQQDDGLNKIMSQYPDSFGPLFQYFIHLLNVSQNEYAVDIEELFKDTFEYTSLAAIDKVAFMDLCKSIYLSIEAKYSRFSGALKFADKTGFSVPSVLTIMREKSENKDVSDLNSWTPERLFNTSDNRNLSEKIRVIGALKETGLGIDNGRTPFSPEVVANILIAWVNGEKINTISSFHPAFRSISDDDKRISEFVKHLTNVTFKSSWGLGALEGIVRGNADQIEDSYIPSYVYYGVDNPKALALRMAGIPRFFSRSLSKALPDDLAGMTLSDVQARISSLSDAEWDSYRPKSSKLSSREWRSIVSILMREK